MGNIIENIEGQKFYKGEKFWYYYKFTDEILAGHVGIMDHKCDHNYNFCKTFEDALEDRRKYLEKCQCFHGDKELAEYLNCSVQTVKQLKSTGKINFYCMGYQCYYLRSEIDKDLQNEARQLMQKGIKRKPAWARRYNFNSKYLEI